MDGRPVVYNTVYIYVVHVQYSKYMYRDSSHIYASICKYNCQILLNDEVQNSL